MRVIGVNRKNRMSFRRFSTGALAAMLASLPACYSYVPPQPSQPEPGSDIRVHLTSEGAQELVPRFGPEFTELGGYRSTRVGGIVSGDNEARSSSLRADRRHGTETTLERP